VRYKTLSNFNFKGKTVLLRADLNSPVENGKVVMNERLTESLKTIRELRGKGARVVVLAHQGRQGNKDFVSLTGHAKLMRIKFVQDLFGDRALKEIEGMKEGEVILLENVRKHKEEFNPGKNKMIKVLSGVCDIYINDAFSVSHRKQSSIVGFPRVMKSGIGRLMENELNHLERLDLGKTLFILGGAKPEDNIMLMKQVLRKNGRVLACGIFGQLCLIASGIDLGQKKYLKNKMRFVKELKKYVSRIETPIDYAVNVSGKRKEIPLRDFPSKYEIYDIGEKTQASFIDEVKKVKSVFVKGTMGVCEEKAFCEGTREVLKAISMVRGHKVLGGGHLSTAVGEMGINKKKFDHISLSGGAFARYVAGERLVGLEVLNKKRKK